MQLRKLALPFIGWMLVSSLAQAQGAVPEEQFSANRFFPATGADNYLMVDGALTVGNLAPTARITLDYAHRPFVLYTARCTSAAATDCEVEESQINVVDYMFTTNMSGSITFMDRFQVGLLLPLVQSAGDSFAARTGPRLRALGIPYVFIPGGHAFGLGDLRLTGKAHLLGKGVEGFQLGAVAYMTFPLGSATTDNRYIGHDGFTGGGHLAAEYRVGSVFRAALNLGGVYRPEKTSLSTTVGSEMTYGVAGELRATELVGVIAELNGATRFSSELDENPLELLLAGTLDVGDFKFTLGPGIGLISGVGIPNFRVVGGAGWAPHGLDADGDGIEDAADQCPTEPEDKDNSADDDGCPEADNDGDGFDDTADRCPDEAEDKDGVEDTDGCPDRDNDGDGIQDGYDSCPMEAEDKDGDRDDDGCPDDDKDRDGVPDSADKCVDEPEDTDGFGDEDGCPETDFDGDTIPDDTDQCPDEIEDADGFEDEDGCAEEGGPPPAAKAKR
jgi:OOP family OmpA-OmpF porin